MLRAKRVEVKSRIPTVARIPRVRRIHLQQDFGQLGARRRASQQPKKHYRRQDWMARLLVITMIPFHVLCSEDCEEALCRALEHWLIRFVGVGNGVCDSRRHLALRDIQECHHPQLDHVEPKLRHRSKNQPCNWDVLRCVVVALSDLLQGTEDPNLFRGHPNPLHRQGCSMMGLPLGPITEVAGPECSGAKYLCALFVAGLTLHTD